MPRWLEIILATVLLIVLSWLLISCAIAVALTSAGWVVFRQRRVGRHGQLFTLLKFRTMRPAAQGLNLTLEDDPRITRAGRFLRQTHLDELPQLINILRGEMSFVGPRPEVPEFADVIQAVAPQLLNVRPGLTDEGTLGALDEGQRLLFQADPSSYYREVLLPEKLSRSLRSSEERTTLSDLQVLFRTVGGVLRANKRKETRDEALA